MSTASVVRNKVVRCFGTPNRTVGSVNEPREQEEHGRRFNEKWVYKLSQATADQPTERVIYWLRYDFVGSYLVGPTGVATPENLADELARVDDRRYLPR
jgi:hypothetical protein